MKASGDAPNQVTPGDASSPGIPLRKDIDDQFLRSIFLLNGSGIVVLLAFLQALWDNDSARAAFQGIGLGMASMLVGLVLAAVAPVLRRRVSRLYELHAESRFFWERLSWSTQLASLLMFVVGAVFVIVALFCAV